MTVIYRNKFLAWSATLGLLATAASQRLEAEELNRSHIPADAKWLVHVDYDALSDTKLVEKVRESNPQLVQGVRDWIRGRYGIDTQEGLHGLTMYSRDYKAHTGTLVMYAEYDRDKVEAELKTNKTLKETAEGDTTFYTITVGHHDSHVGKHADAKAKHMDAKHGEDKDAKTKEAVSKDKDQKSETKQDAGDKQKGKDKGADKKATDKTMQHDKMKHDKSGGMQMTVVLLEGKVLFASSVESGKQALQLLDGKAESLEGQDSELVSEMPDGILMYGAAIELGKISQHELLFPVLRQHSRATWAVGNKDGKLYEKTCLVADSDDVAEKMQTVAEGAVAYKKLWMSESEASQTLLNDVSIERDGKELKIEWEGETDKVHSALADFGKYLNAWKQAMGN